MTLINYILKTALNGNFSLFFIYFVKIFDIFRDITYNIVILKGGDMKKLTLTTIIILGIGLAMILVGAVLEGIVNWGTGFNGDALASALTTIGYIVAMLSGVVLTGMGIAYAIKSGSSDCHCDDNCSCGCKDDKNDKKKESKN